MREPSRRRRGLDRHQLALVSLLDEHFTRFDLTRDDVATVLELSDTMYSDFRAGRRIYQRHHVGRLIALLRERGGAARHSTKLPGRPRPWTRWDEYELLSTFVRGVRPSRGGDAPPELWRRRAQIGGHRREVILNDFEEGGFVAVAGGWAIPEQEVPAGLLADIHRRLQQEEALARTEALAAERRPVAPVAIEVGSTFDLVSVERSWSIDEPRRLRMTFQPSDPSRRVALRRVFGQLPEEQRETLLSRVPDGVAPGIGAGFQVLVSIVTDDRRLLFRKETANEGGTDRFVCTAMTSPSSVGDLDGNGSPSPAAVALRCTSVSELLADNRDRLPHRLRLHAVLCDARSYDWILCGVLDLAGTSITASDIIADAFESTRGAMPAAERLAEDLGLVRRDDGRGERLEPDSWVGVPLTLEDVVAFVVTQPVTDASFINALLTLMVVEGTSLFDLDQELRLYPPSEPVA